MNMQQTNITLYRTNRAPYSTVQRKKYKEDVSFSDTLMHYGVSGQKWGERRYQNADGTLTDEGRRHYGILDERGQYNPQQQLKDRYQRERSSQQKWIDQIQRERANGVKVSQRRANLIDYYRSKGLSEEQAQIHAARREKTEKVLKIAGAVALTAALAYGAYKGHQWLSRLGDKTVRKGTEVQSMLSRSNVDLGRDTYVSINAKDSLKYRGMYGNTLKEQAKVANKFQRLGGGTADAADAYRMTAKAGSNIRIAGERNSRKAFDSLLKNDSEFAKGFEKVRSQFGANGDMTTAEKYDLFNRRLIDRNTQEMNSMREKFYAALKNKGYGGVIDVNDRRYSGTFKTKDPTILFNLKDNISNVKVTKMADSVIQSDYQNAKALLDKEAATAMQLVKARRSFSGIGRYLGIGAGALGAGKIYSDSERRKTESENRNLYRAVIREYKKEHPNTKLSDDQILENELGHS